MKIGLFTLAIPCLAIVFCLPVHASEISDLNKRISDLEAKMAKSEEKNKRKLQTLQDSIKEDKQALRFSGFATAGATKGDVDFTTADRAFTDEWGFSSDTRAAVQADYRIDEHWSATIQMMGRAAQDWDTKTEWAFIKYQPNDQLAIRAGRLRLPLYNYSESLDIGFVYPWVRPPMPHYVTSISNYEGVDATYRFATGNITHEVNVLTGATKGTLPSGLTLQLDNVFGANYTGSYEALSLRLQALRTDVNATVGAFGPQDDRIHYYTGTLTYNDGTVLVMMEAARSVTDWTLVRTADSGQFTFGYRFGDWLPYGVLAKAYSVDDGDAVLRLPPTFTTPILPRTQMTNTGAGVVYQASAQVNIKCQYDHFYGLDGGNDNFKGLKEGSDVYSINVNAIF